MDLRNVAGKVIGLGVSGGIAAYKVVELARELTKAGADVRVVMSPAATEFVGPITFSTLTGNPVRTELFPAEAPSKIPHTDLGRTADLIVIAPATAKTLAKFAQGISDDLLSALLLSAKGPIIMAPAMHTEMWENEATQENIATLKSRGVRFVGPDVGALAGPDVGIGRLTEIENIVAAIDEELERKEDLTDVRILVTAGGTQEPIDSVRFIGNRSSGRMGFELAFEAVRRGAKVTLITGPTHLDPPEQAETIKVVTASEMKSAVMESARDARVIIMAAAVSDWRPKTVANEKLKKSAGPPRIDLEATDDILAKLGSSRNDSQVLVGFAAETGNLEGYAKEKLASKGADMIVANLVGTTDSGFDVETNRAALVFREGEVQELPIMSKRELAGLILDSVRQRFL
jgi:phosphopantothenoylcysteine decarboxylase/phosphopantothenate--cysteine ligase